MENCIKNGYPAIPLITCDPYMSIWSMSDKLYEDYPRHWTGRIKPLTGIICVDGAAKTFMGQFRHNPLVKTYNHGEIEQTDLKITPLRSIYTFRDNSVELKVTFMTPLLPDDLELMSRPVSYISYEIASVDGREHNCSIYFDVSALLCVDKESGDVAFGRDEISVYCGKGDCGDMLAVSGDDLRIDWGYLHLAAKNGKMGFTDNSAKYQIYYKRKNGDRSDLEGKTVPVDKEYPVLYFMNDYKVKETVSDFICVAYDDIYSLEYFGKKIKAYYLKDGETFSHMLKKAVDEYDEIERRVEAFDEKLTADAQCISENYAQITAIAYRQTVAAHKLAWTGDEAVFISKECFSNGCAATVDITYPSMPLFLVYNPDLVEYMLTPIFKYANSADWKYEFAPHDVGTYPLVNGQAYGMTMEMQMPIEECGNMLLCVAALCKKRKNADIAEKHFDLLNSWAEYLIKFGYDPENQLCTDDFAGHLAHNCNLSVKAILGIAAWGMILNMLGKDNTLGETAREYAAKWKKEAFENNHYKLSFDSEGTWSIKYNLVWDKLLELGIFDEDIAKTEVEYYKKKMNTYGLPLDSRSEYTKSDWQMWSTVLTDDREYADMIIDSMRNMLSDTADKVPFTDFYYSDNACRAEGFQNRTVQGGLFINLLKFDE